MKRMIALVLAASVLGACDDSTGIGDGAQVSVEFTSRASGTAMSVAGPGGLALASIDVAGSNGVVTLESAHAILAEFELELAESVLGCDDDLSGSGELDDDCHEVEKGPMFVELPLESGEVTSVSGTVDPGAYDEVEFEFENLDDEEDDPAEAQRNAELLAEIRTEYPDWPQKASIRLSGTFTPTGGDPVAFVAYGDVEIEIEMEFDSPFVVTEEDVSRTIMVVLDPRDWLLRSDNTVIDLSAWDWDTTGQLFGFEIEIEDGFKSVEHDD